MYHHKKKNTMREVTQEALLPQPHPLFLQGRSPGSGRDFYTHVEMLPYDKITTSMNWWKYFYMGDPAPRFPLTVCSYTLVGCCSLGVVNTFAIFSSLDIWRDTSASLSLRVTHAAPIATSRRRRTGDLPPIWAQKSGLKSSSVKSFL